MGGIVDVTRDSYDVTEIEPDRSEDPLDVRHRPPHFLFKVPAHNHTLVVHRGLTRNENETVRFNGGGEGKMARDWCLKW